jgi:outer membrane receptor protein involved in Fe transport
MEGGPFDLDVQQFNPKLGLTWNILPNTTLRAAVFRTLKRTLITNQTVEPTQVAGFNQFFDEPTDGTDAWRYGIGLDQKLTNHLFVGVEMSRRELTFMGKDARTQFISNIEVDSSENLARAYFYWTPHPWFSLGPEYQYEQTRFGPELPLNRISQLETHRIGVGASLFHPSGFLATFKPTLVFQEGDFRDFPLGPLTFQDSEFLVIDGSIGYRLPRRFGIIEIEAKNLFDKRFDFQDTDPGNQSLAPKRLIAAKWTLSF